MNAPIDIVIRIIYRKMTEVNASNCEPRYAEGMLDAYQNLIEEFEGFKKLFN